MKNIKLFVTFNLLVFAFSSLSEASTGGAKSIKCDVAYLKMCRDTGRLGERCLNTPPYGYGYGMLVFVGDTNRVQYPVTVFPSTGDAASMVKGNIAAAWALAETHHPDNIKTFDSDPFYVTGTFENTADGQVSFNVLEIDNKYKDGSWWPYDCTAP